MAQDFSKIVEDVKQLSTPEKEELQELLRSFLIEEGRREGILRRTTKPVSMSCAKEQSHFHAIRTRFATP